VIINDLLGRDAMNQTLRTRRALVDRVYPIVRLSDILGVRRSRILPLAA
jgi:hypothetical protein